MIRIQECLTKELSWCHFLSATISVQVQVIGSSQNPPYFEDTGETVQYLEGQPPNTTVVTVVAMDPDPGTVYL